MEPNTASRLQERRKNRLKDFVHVAGPMGVSHFLLLSQTESCTNLRMAKFPQGPTLYFRIQAYSLMKEVAALQKKPKSPGSEFLTAPLIVLNNMPVETSHGKLMCSMFQGMFPTINTTKVKLAEIRRVVLFHYDREKDTVEFRHYTINVKIVGVSKSVKRIIRSEIPDLGNFADAAEFVLKAEANLSDSEFEEDSVVTLAQNYPGVANNKSQQRSINLVECGPRLNLKLIKVTDGLNAGKVLYHVPDEDVNIGGEDSDEEMGDE
jgi:ribosome biogenesis protein SSF1/2